MKIISTLSTVPVLVLAAQAQAAVPVSGFTIDGASRPYGLILITLLLVGIGVKHLRSSS